MYTTQWNRGVILGQNYRIPTETHHMKKKKPVTSAGYFWKNPTGATASLHTSPKSWSAKTKTNTFRAPGPGSSQSGPGAHSNQANQPHPLESLDEAALASTDLRFLAGEVSSSTAGRSCLPHNRFPPALTAVFGVAAAKVTVVLSLLA